MGTQGSRVLHHSTELRIPTRHLRSGAPGNASVLSFFRLPTPPLSPESSSNFSHEHGMGLAGGPHEDDTETVQRRVERGGRRRRKEREWEEYEGGRVKERSREEGKVNERGEEDETAGEVKAEEG
ncbi:hypothetical protein Tco_0164853 [Tanacetum coccineum]